MKRKLRLLLFTMILSVSYLQAQVKTDVWDFGAGEQTPTTSYNNNLTKDIMNAWFPGVTPGSTDKITMPKAFTVGDLSWVGNASDKLRTTNIELTRTDNSNDTSVLGFNGRINCNGSTTGSDRYFNLTLKEDDEVVVYCKTDIATGALIVTNTTTNLTLPLFTVSNVKNPLTEIKFAAKDAGTFKIYSTNGSKGDYFRITRKPATYATVTGTIDETAASGIAGYSVVFTNDAGKSWTFPVTNKAYTATLPIGYGYKVSLKNANGYIITTGKTLTVSGSAIIHDLTLLKVDLFTVSGALTGLGTDISKATLVYTPNTSKTYVPEPVINTVTTNYTVDLEPNTLYNISAQGINDYEISPKTITITEATSFPIAFAKKPTYDVTINTSGLNATQLTNFKLIFTNLNETGYSYTFNAPTATTVVPLRDGTYSVTYSGLDNYPVEMALTYNLKVAGSTIIKDLTFNPVNVWSFDEQSIATTTTAGYKGMLLAGTISNRLDKGDLTAKTGATIKIPVKNVGDKVSISYYFAANFTIAGGAPITTTSGSTSTLENVEYTTTAADATAGYVTITAGGTNYTSYFTEIKVLENAPYVSTITVGTDKQYKTINEALTAVSNMTRTATDRVTITIDPGNYEEMLVITQPNVTLKNAASNPSIALSNKGVDINANAVRITSYYGHGYNYYSMKNQKWDADVLRVNKLNGSLSYTNVGAGTTNGSYWNATVVVNANGFEANDIIFENSYNQYISLKESQDIVVKGPENKGDRPTDYGNTAVQDKTFVERAAAIAVLNNIDKVVLNKCRVIGRQDSFYGGTAARVVVYKGVMMGGTDFLFGPMNAVFYKTDLAMNTSADKNDVAYITAAQQKSGRGYLMYECKVTSAIPGTETASTQRSKPGYFGRPWEPTYSEVVFYNTTVETTDFTGSEGKLLIMPLGWLNTLNSAESPLMYEYGTVDSSNTAVDTSARAAWATTLKDAGTTSRASIPKLLDGTEITILNFTKGSDNWNPIPDIVTNDPSLGIKKVEATSAVNVYAFKNNVAISNVTSNTLVNVYSLSGSLIKSFKTDADTNFNLKAGVWIVVVKAADGQKATKVITH